MPIVHPDARVQRIVQRFESLSEADLPRLGDLYAADARFKDPFNEVVGPAAIAAIFEHMFRTLDAPRFIVTAAVAEEGECFLAWDFRFCMRRGDRAEQCIRGSSHLRLTADGRISEHRDYWDAAEELYEKLPVLGALMRWLRRRVNSG
jgi:steroid Delta-isomerase